MISMLTVVPAYGRDYTKSKDAAADWFAGKDFLISDVSSRWNGSYCSSRDLKGVPVTIRFNNNRNSTTVIDQSFPE